ncbi:MAG TPA: hypothetical protein VE982_06850 [Gaiellaceae bacterium]|nr:hypothetical protein [Gaiellaceae bacterium]
MCSPSDALRLVRAEIVKLVTRRGLVAAAVLLTIGTTVVAYAILELLHLGDPAKHGPAGGTQNFVNATWLLTQLGSIAVILLGATAGAGDLGAGFFRMLVVTGRSRLALFAARLPSGLAVALVLSAAEFALVAAATVLLAGGKATPSPALLVQSGLWIVAYMSVVYLVAVGLASLLGSRSTTIALLVGLQLAVTPVLQEVHGLHVPRELVLGVAVWQLAPRVVQAGAPRSDLAMSQGAIAAVLVGWVAAAVVAGAWKTITREA